MTGRTRTPRTGPMATGTTSPVTPTRTGTSDVVHGKAVRAERAQRQDQLAGLLPPADPGVVRDQRSVPGRVHGLVQHERPAPGRPEASSWGGGLLDRR